MVNDPSFCYPLVNKNPPSFLVNTIKMGRILQWLKVSLPEWFYSLKEKNHAFFFPKSDVFLKEKRVTQELPGKVSESLKGQIQLHPWDFLKYEICKIFTFNLIQLFPVSRRPAPKIKGGRHTRQDFEGS